jgi:histidinol-phosphate aminotransferase
MPEIRGITHSVVAERERLKSELASLPSVQVTDSQANFLWVRTPTPAKDVFSALAASGILVRSFHERGGRLLHQLRVTIGTPAENAAFLSAFRKLV